MQRNPFGTYDNSVPVADCSLVEERAAFEALFLRGRAVRDTLVGLRIALCTDGAAQIEVDGRRYDFREGGVLCLTEKYLIRTIGRTTGHTPAYWIAGFRLREANVLLRSTDLSVTEISELLGFASPSLFARFYRRLSGSSPLEARKAAR